MAVNQSYGISVVLALNAAAIEGSQLPASDPTTIVTITHGRCTMTVTLTGIDFDVTSTSPAEQSFISTDSLTWEWQVAPKRAGQALALKLVIQPKVNSGGGNVLLGRAQSITQTIQVDTQQENVPAHVLGMADDIASNDLFRFLFPSSAVLVAFFIWIRRRLPTARPAPEDPPADADDGPDLSPEPAPRHR